MKSKEDKKNSLPLGLCPFLFYSIYPYLLILARGGKFDWVKEGEGVVVSCPMENGIVTCIKRVKDRIIIEIIKNKGKCEFKYKVLNKVEIEISLIDEKMKNLYDNFPFNR